MKTYVFTFDHNNNKWSSCYEGIDKNMPSIFESSYAFPNVFTDWDYLDVEDEHFDEKTFQVNVEAHNYDEARNDFVDFLMMIKTNYNLFNLYH